MKTLVYIWFLALAAGCSQPSPKGNSLDVEKEKSRLRYLKQVEWPSAYAKQDTVLLDRLLSDQFVMIDADGNWFTKQDELEWIKGNATDNDSFYYEIKRLEIFANGTAIVSGTGHIWKDSTKTRYQSSNVLIKTDTLWRAVQSHVSGIVTE